HKGSSQCDRTEAGSAHCDRVATAERLSDPNGRCKRDTEWDHEQDGCDLQRDLMGGKRGGSDPPHQERARGEQPPFEHEGARDRQSDRNQLTQQLPVRSPESPEYAILFERTAGIANPNRGGTHCNVDERGGEPGAEQIKPRRPERTIDECISEHPVYWDGSDG